MAKFEKGDRVRITDNNPYILSKKQLTGTVTEKISNGLYDVDVDNYDARNLLFEPHQLTKIKSEAVRTTKRYYFLGIHVATVKIQGKEYE